MSSKPTAHSPRTTSQLLVGTITPRGRFQRATFGSALASLADLIKQEQFSSPGHEAMLNVLVTYPWIMGELAATMAEFDLTPAQYNVLRILRGAHPERVACSYIGQRLLDRTPDVTRLLDRLEKADLSERRRGAEDRRVVEVGITEQGRERLDSMDAPVNALTSTLMANLSEAEQRQLSALLEKLRGALPAPDSSR